MPFCKNCGKEVSDDIAYCPSCGTKLKEEVSVVVEKKKADQPSSSTLTITILALIFSLIPYVSIAGFILGIVGLTRKDNNNVTKCLSILGIIFGILNLVSLILSLFVYPQFVYGWKFTH